MEQIMSTKAQILANRRNAQKSSGPRTSDGKAAVSQNTLKHGLTAANDVIYSENQPDFELYRDRILAELAPASPIESMLSERIVSLSWRLKRSYRIQNQAIDALNADRTSNPFTKLTQSLLPKGLRQPQDDSATSDAALGLGRLAVSDFSYARVLEHLLMYERRLEHSLYKTILELQRLNIVKRLNTGCETPFTNNQLSFINEQ